LQGLHGRKYGIDNFFETRVLVRVFILRRKPQWNPEIGVSVFVNKCTKHICSFASSCVITDMTAPRPASREQTPPVKFRGMFSALGCTVFEICARNEDTTGWDHELTGWQKTYLRSFDPTFGWWWWSRYFETNCRSYQQAIKSVSLCSPPDPLTSSLLMKVATPHSLTLWL